MIWRRVLVPETMSLHELHGVLKVAMGWEAIHLFQFSVRGVVHAGPAFGPASPWSFPFRISGFAGMRSFRYVYDMRCWWEHELRIEDRVLAGSGQ